MTRNLIISEGIPDNLVIISVPLQLKSFSVVLRPANRFLRIFDKAEFLVNITLPEGSSDVHINVTAVTALSLNFSMSILEWGDNFCCRNKSLFDEKATASAGAFTDKDKLKWIMHLTNTGETK